MRFDRYAFLFSALAVAAVHASPAYAAAKSAAELNAIASLRFQSAQTQAVSARIADAQILALRSRVETSEAALGRVRGQLKTAESAARRDKAEVARLNGELDGLLSQLAQAKTDFTDELARRDADYARDIAILQMAGEQLLATPEGLHALELYNAGGPGAFEAADAVLGQIEEARSKAREDAALVQQAEDRRARARLALDARDRGLTTTDVAIERWQAVVATGKATMRDWVNLCDLYLASGQVEKGLAAAHDAVKAAKDDDEMGPALGRLGEALDAANDEEGALKARTQLLEVNRRRLAADPGSLEKMRFVSLALRYRGDSLLWLGEVDEARANFEESLAIDRQRLELEPKLETRREISVDISRLADADAAAGDLASAIARQREALDRDRAVLAEDPQLMMSRQNVARTLSGLAALEMDFGRFADAARMLREAVEISSAMIAIDPRSAEFLGDKANYLRQLAYAQRQLGEAAEAEALYREALALARQQVAVDPGSAYAQDNLADLLLSSADMAMDRFDYGAALAHAEEALAISRQLLASSPSSSRQASTAAKLNGVGVVLELSERFDEARKAYEEALALVKLAEQRDSSVDLQEQRAELENNLTDLSSKTGDFAEAVNHARAAVAIRRKVFELGETHSGRDGLADSLDRLATALRESGRTEASLPVWKEAIALRRAIMAETQVAKQDGTALAKTLSMGGYAAGLARDAEFEQTALHEAAVLYRDAAARDPAGYLSALVTVLADLSRAERTSAGERVTLIEERIDLTEHGPKGLRDDGYLGGALLDLAQARLDAGDKPGAHEAFGRALEVLHRAAAADPGNHDFRRLLSFAATDRARLSGSETDWAAAQAEINQWRAAEPLPDDVGDLVAEVAAHAIPVSPPGTELTDGEPQ